MKNDFPCKCGHLRIRHANMGMGTKELLTYCNECCPTDFDEQVHPFIPDNLAYLEQKAEDE